MITPLRLVLTLGWLLLALQPSLQNPQPLAAQEPIGNPHGELREGLTCLSCHTTEAWAPLRSDLKFDHADDGGYALDGRHADATCEGCHTDLVFDQATADLGDCSSCHVDVHQGTATRTCTSCHTTESFLGFPLGIVHPADFPLEGAHLQTSCESCHTDDFGGAFTPVDRECATCHFNDYASAFLVDHQALGFSTDCTECHTSVDFRDVLFDHFTISGGFELNGQHSAIECTECHSLPGGGLPTIPAGAEDCVACHLEDYQEEHGGSGFPTDCLACHTSDDWDDAEFDHASVTGFALIPSHDMLLCVECHVGSTSQTFFNPTGPEDCVACHLEDYQEEHGGSGFPTDCLACHTPDDWDDAEFDHAFQIFNGPHAQEWNDCADCHTTPGDFVSFSCFGCHGQTQMDDEHSEEPGYAYDSPTCLSCHPTGRGG
jgi:hypothetical protein